MVNGVIFLVVKGAKNEVNCEKGQKYCVFYLGSGRKWLTLRGSKKNSML